MEAFMIMLGILGLALLGWVIGSFLQDVSKLRKDVRAIREILEGKEG